METWSSLGQLSYQVSNLDDKVGGRLGIYAWVFRTRSYVAGMTAIAKRGRPIHMDDEETREVVRGSM
jgi:hypothetical protein